MKKIRVHFSLNVVMLWLGILTFLYANKSYLRGWMMFVHDTIYWSGATHYFSESILNGFFPIWNTYVHSGEFFVENFTQESLIDPVNFLCILFAAVFRMKDLLIIYNISVLFKIVALATGTQLLLNELIPAQKKYWAFSFAIMLLSSFATNGYHQNGAYLCIGYFPWVLYFFFRAQSDQSWKNFVGMGYFLGVSLQTAVFAYQATCLLVFLFLYLLFFWKESLRLFVNWGKILVMLGLFLVLATPALALFPYQSWIVPYARNVFNPHDGAAGIFLQSAESLRNSLAASGKIRDLATFILPSEFFKIVKVWQEPAQFSEMSFYAGILLFCLAFAGLVKGKNRYKKMFIAFFLTVLVIYLGPANGKIYDLLFLVLIPLRVIENTHTFVSFVFLAYFYFVALGVSFLTAMESLSSRRILFGVFIITLGELLFYHEKVYHKSVAGSFALPRSAVAADLIKASDYPVLARVKSLIAPMGPMALVDNTDQWTFPVLSLTNVRYLRPEESDGPVNFLSSMLKKPSAFDFPVNFPLRFLKILPPRALTYPRLYAEILKSEVSEELKSQLLGIDLPPVQFFARASFMTPAEILDVNQQEKVLERVKDSILISPDESSLKPQPSLYETSEKAELSVGESHPGFLRIKIENSREGYLLYRDGFNPSWIAEVNGVTQKVLRANYNQKAVLLAPGTNVVEFMFRPQVYIVSLVLYALASIFVFFFAGFTLFKPYLARRALSKNT